MNNDRNLLIYRRWAPFYDQVIGRWPGLNRARRRFLSIAGLRPGERALFVGVGTGLDLPLVPEDLEVVGVDLSPEILERAKLMAKNRPSIRLLRMNAENLVFPEGSFDAVFLHLILSVVEHPRGPLPKPSGFFASAAGASSSTNLRPSTGGLRGFPAFEPCGDPAGNRY